MKRKYLVLLLVVFLTVLLVAVGCQKQPVTPTPEPPVAQPPAATPTYVGTSSCAGCHKDTHTGFTKTSHYTTFKPLATYNIADLPKEITVFDTAVTENPPSAKIDPSTAIGVMVDDYVIAKAPAGFKNPYYRVAAVHKSGDKWVLEPASKGDYNKDGNAQDWGASNYTCGSCHSPGVGKTDKESTIGCESCHGPGSSHVAAENKAGTMQVSQDSCMTCHPSYPAKNAEGVWEANNHYGTRNYFASKHADSSQLNNCLTCHAPHNANSAGKMVVGNNVVADNCAKCHKGVNFDLAKLMWVNKTDARDHFVKDHSFGAMPYEKLGDKDGTKPVEITNPDMIKIIEEKVPQKK